MDAFKKASTLHEDYGRKPKPPPARGRVTPTFLKSKTHKCEHHNQGICEASREAIRLGLRKEAIPCTGNIPPDCKIRQELETGKTIQEIYHK